MAKYGVQTAEKSPVGKSSSVVEEGASLSKCPLLLSPPTPSAATAKVCGSSGEKASDDQDRKGLRDAVLKSTQDASASAAAYDRLAQSLRFARRAPGGERLLTEEEQRRRVERKLQQKQKEQKRLLEEQRREEGKTTSRFTSPSLQ